MTEMRGKGSNSFSKYEKVNWAEENAEFHQVYLTSFVQNWRMKCWRNNERYIILFKLSQFWKKKMKLERKLYSYIEL